MSGHRVVTVAQGFTLVEMLITVTVAGVLAALATPSFSTYIAMQRIRGATFSLSSALIFARSEAIKRNATVDVLATNASWNKGWTVSFGGTVLRTVDASPQMAITAAPTVTQVSFGSDGRLTSASAVFTVASAATSSSASPRCLTIGLSGMPSYPQSCP
jgi:type IV fimbrial biogenesis protein FimT